MSHQNIWGPYSLPAGADLSASQYCGVVINTSGQLVLGTAGALVEGVLDNAPASGEQARINFQPGVLKFRAGAAIAIGDLIVLGSSGKWIKGVTTGHVRMAKALSVAGAADEFFTAFWMPGLYGTVP